MPIPFKCPHCGVTGKAKDSYASCTTSCPKCGKPVTIAPIENRRPPVGPRSLRESGTPATVTGSASERKRIRRNFVIPRRVWPSLTILLGFFVVLLGAALESVVGFGFATPWLALFALAGFLIVLIAPAGLAYWQVRTPQRGTVPRHHVIAMAEWSAFIIATLVFVSTLHEDTDGIPWPNRLSLIIALSALLSKVARHTYKRKAWLALIPLILLTTFAWSRYDYQEHHWVSDENSNGSHAKSSLQQWSYTDYIYRGHEHPFFRKLSRFGGDKDDIFFISMSGPMSESGKPHGHWKTFIQRKAERVIAPEREFEDIDEWYWYGELVSEGEWHLRNRDTTK